MNLLLIEATELGRDNTVHLSGRRAEHLRRVLNVKPGKVLRAGVINGSIAQAEVLSVTDSGVELRLSGFLESSRPEHWQTKIVVALPRPQVVKRVLQLVALYGVSELHFIRTSRVEKSYFQSPVLNAVNVGQQLVLGLEQGGLTRLPKVEIHRRFRPFIEDVLPTVVSPKGSRFVLNPGAEHNFSGWVNSGIIASSAEVCFSFGPEGGWVEFELEQWKTSGFRETAISSSILTVEYAICAALSQFEHLRKT